MLHREILAALVADYKTNMTVEKFLETYSLTENAFGCFLLTPTRKDGSVMVCTEAAHRIVARKFGVLKDSTLDVHHTCETRNCMNPFHFQTLTRSEHVKLHAALRRKRRGK